MVGGFRRMTAALTGLVFLTAALPKLADPVGTGLIVEEYFKFLHLGWLIPLSETIGILLSLLEAVLGAALVTGVFSFITAIATLAMLAFFTLISLLLLIFNPQMDCGCFGQMISLTHTQTFIKNLILDALAVVSFVPFPSLGSARVHRYVSFFIALAMLLAFTLYSQFFVPLADFTELRPSHTIMASESGENKYENPYFPLFDISGEYCSEIITQGPVAVISVYDADALDGGDRQKIASFAQEAFNAGYLPVLAANDVSFGIPGLDTYCSDHRKLLTLNRVNGGVTLLYDGYIINKYSNLNYPSRSLLEQTLAKDPSQAYIDAATSRSMLVQLGVMLLLCVMFFV